MLITYALYVALFSLPACCFNASSKTLFESLNKEQKTGFAFLSARTYNKPVTDRRLKFELRFYGISPQNPAACSARINAEEWDHCDDCCCVTKALVAKLETFIYAVKFDITGLHFSSSALGVYQTAPHTNAIVGYSLSGREQQTTFSCMLTWLTS